MYPYTIDQMRIMISQLMLLLPLHNYLYKVLLVLWQVSYCSNVVTAVCAYEHCIPTIVPSLAIGLLEESDLDVVANELDAVSRNWYTLGQNLISTQDLDSIRTKYPNDKLRMREMLSYWLEYSPTTWSAIVAGLRSSGDSQLADHLHSKYCPSEFTTT